MRDAWNEICLDTDCHPLDITHQGKKLFFEPGHWAKLTARLLFVNAIRLKLAAPSPCSGQGERELANAIGEYARDLRRNSSGGDDYPWEIMRGVADYLDVLLGRYCPHVVPNETIDRVAHAIIGTMFAPHELPVDDELWHKYRDTARAAIAAVPRPNCGCTENKGDF
jgi:hypothetical protein